MTPAIPPIDPAPVPGPLWLFKALLYGTFLVHLTLVNFLVGGSVLAAVYCFKGKEKHLAAAFEIAAWMPQAMAFAISFGVAPLLFVQVLYGPLFYSAAIACAVPFIAIVPALVLAYYGIYLLSWRWEQLGARRPWLSLAILSLLAYTAFTYVNTFTLMLAPERIKPKYLAHPGGFQLNLAEPTIAPRFLHVFFAAVAVAGLFVAFNGLRKMVGDPGQGRWQFRSGLTWFSGATIVEMAAGAWWLLALPREQMIALMGGDIFASVAFVLGLACSVASLAAALRAINSLKPKPLFHFSLYTLLATILCMIIIRDAVRDAAVEKLFALSSVATSPQWGVFALFLLFLAAGAWAITWLVRVMRSAGK